jgi:hypothetical protein
MGKFFFVETVACVHCVAFICSYAKKRAGIVHTREKGKLIDDSLRFMHRVSSQRC